MRRPVAVRLIVGVARPGDQPADMSEGSESKQAPDTVQEAKPEPMAAAGQAVSSVSPPVSVVNQPAATEDEEEESEDESEILEESPCGRWQKRREEVIR